MKPQLRKLGCSIALIKQNFHVLSKPCYNAANNGSHNRQDVNMKYFLTNIAFITMMVLNANSVFADSENSKTCSCDKIPARFAAKQSTATHRITNSTTNTNHTGMVEIPAGIYQMGGDNHQARKDELPKHTVNIPAFWMDTTEVTNAQFEQFVKKTGYITVAEKKPNWEDLKKQLPPNTPKPDDSKLVAASLVFTPPNHAVALNDYSQWWSWMPGANWAHPRGPDSNIQHLSNHPVVHIAWIDAATYCKSQGKRLPTEAEWEWAARGGLENKIYAWGNEPIDTGRIKANTWQGEFPDKNTQRDSFYYTSPVKSYPANGYGLYDMAGNVWEWVSDWYRVDYYSSLVNHTTTNPQGPADSYDPAEPYAQKKVLRGGSFLCNESYCSGYRNASRMKSTPDTSMEHIGFRCAMS